MFDNNALWHRCCRLAYSDTLTERMLEQHKKENPPEHAPETAPEREPDGQAHKFPVWPLYLLSKNNKRIPFQCNLINMGTGSSQHGTRFVGGQYIVYC